MGNVHVSVPICGEPAETRPCASTDGALSAPKASPLVFKILIVFLPVSSRSLMKAKLIAFP